MPVSQNGYPANDVNLTSVRRIPGTERDIRVRKGPAGDLLLWVAGQFDARVENIDGGQLDDWGYAEREIRGGVELSNHASGTAIDLNAPRHPLGASGTFSRAQVKAIHRILSQAGYCVRWGGDYRGRKDEMHFEVNASEAACRKALARVHNVEERDDMKLTEDVKLGEFASEARGGQEKLTVAGALGDAAGGAYVAADVLELLRKVAADLKTVKSDVAKLKADLK